MAKRNMPKMANRENLETKVEKTVPAVEEVAETEEIVEPVEEKVAESETRFVTVDCDKQLRLRAASSTSADVLTLLNPGTKCEVIDGNSEWLKVKVAGKIGYVMAKFVK